MKIPRTGRPETELFDQLAAYRAHDLDTHGGRTWAYVYDSGRAEIEAVAKRAYLDFLSINAMDPTVFPSALKLETELVGMAAAHLGGDGEVAGSFTSGGTESCLLAVKTARDYFRARRPEITEPEMILPVTAHAAFHKAAHYFGVKAVQTPVDPRTFKADLDALAAAVTPNTILLVGSAVSYSHGVVDPIPEMGRLALDRGLLLHVDGCIGGFLLPYFRRLGAEVTDFDFSVPGVTSISMDFHKYAYAPKGASVVLYKNRELRKHQFFACSRWTGYVLINATIQSTKSGGPLAAAWAVVNFIGDDGYLEIARRTLGASRRIVAGLNEIPGLRVLGRPEMSLIPFTSDEVDIFQVIDLMKDRGWYIQPQLSFGGSKENVHLSVTAVSLERVEEMLADLDACVKEAEGARPSELKSLATAALSGIDPAHLDDEALAGLMGLAGISGGLPERMAEINGILNSLPPDIAEPLLVAFFNELYR